MTSEPHTFWLSVGSNHPRKEHFIAEAFDLLAQHIDGCHFSRPYTTPALNGKDPEYMNAVVYGHFGGTSSQLASLCKDIEARLGRTRDFVPGAPHLVEIDLDLVVFDGEILRPADFSREYFTTGFNQMREDCRLSDF